MGLSLSRSKPSCRCSEGSWQWQGGLRVPFWGSWGLRSPPWVMKQPPPSTQNSSGRTGSAPTLNTQQQAVSCLDGRSGEAARSTSGHTALWTCKRRSCKRASHILIYSSGTCASPALAAHCCFPSLPLAAISGGRWSPSQTLCPEPSHRAAQLSPQRKWTKRVLDTGRLLVNRNTLEATVSSVATSCCLILNLLPASWNRVTNLFWRNCTSDFTIMTKSLEVWSLCLKNLGKNPMPSVCIYMPVCICTFSFCCG